MLKSEAGRAEKNKIANGMADVVETVTTRRGARLFHNFTRATFRRLLDLTVWEYDHDLISQRLILRACGLVTRTFSKALLQPPPGTRLRRVDFGDFEAEWVWVPGVDDPDVAADPAVILYFHGGGLLVGGLGTHRGIAARMARGSGAAVLDVAYRQIPDGARIEDTLEDCYSAYRYLLDRGIPAERIVLAGDSVGAGLCFYLAFIARERGLAMPQAIAAISPFAEFDLAEKLAHPNNKSEGFCSANFYSLCVRWAVQVDGKVDPFWSLAGRDFAGLPPVFIQVGSAEVLLLDSELIVERCLAAEIPVRLQVWDRVLHDFHLDAALFPDGFDAIDELSSFIRDAFGHAPASR
ncbi:alpha/beta hydrolase [Nocardia colli]|uniref:Alpha/beta hydrolase n=1 Tax=Nocardia colli TaxID=2545717 RepID=A0A5N0E8G1_9NOCA|nr:alpha/beta hydrolase [Nocardia colli]KAA8885702.1 alpha/beta hydrolase [Nocardia colli]